jgi:uncharacterized membrane protein YhaH (DUF805 family)
MSLLNQLISFFKFNIPQRLGRKDYLFNILQLAGATFIFVVFLIVPIVLLDKKTTHSVSIICIILGCVVMMVFNIFITISCGIARLHDLNKSGWWMLLISLVQVICGVFGMDRIGHIFGYIFFGLLLLYPGTKGANKYGETSTISIVKS